MEEILPKLSGVVCFIDDILVTGRSDSANLDAVVGKLQQYGLQLKQKKRKFFQESVST